MYGDEGSDTLGNLAGVTGGLDLPCFQRLGLGNAHLIEGVPPSAAPEASWGRMAERSAGKDSTAGHWEMMGLCSCKGFPTYPGGFPPGIIAAFEEATGRKTLGNRPASGTAIIEELGAEHLRTGALIVYTSADSVFQVAAHEDAVPPSELYAACEEARRILVPPNGVSRVIARPFRGEPGAFYRTAGRRDFSLPPPGRTLLDALADAGIPRTGVGKLDDLFAHRNLETIHVPSNTAALDQLEAMLAHVRSGLVFANLVDFDMRWGHRNDTAGFRAGLEEVDGRLPSILRGLGVDDALLITADHGNDPTTAGTDHSREYVPLLFYVPGRTGRDLGTRSSFSDVASSLCDWFGLEESFPGESFLEGR
jgi:phosphopentomutase